MILSDLTFNFTSPIDKQLLYDLLNKGQGQSPNVTSVY